MRMLGLLVRLLVRYTQNTLFRLKITLAMHARKCITVMIINLKTLFGGNAHQINYMTNEMRVWYGMEKKQVLNIRYMRRTPRCGSLELNGARRCSLLRLLPIQQHFTTQFIWSHKRNKYSLRGKSLIFISLSFNKVNRVNKDDEKVRINTLLKTV